MELMSEEEIGQLELEEAVSRYRDLKRSLAPMLEQIELLKSKIRESALETGEQIQIDGAKVVFRAPYLRSSWDNLGLRGYAVAHPEILDFLKEVEVPATAFVRLT